MLDVGVASGFSVEQMASVPDNGNQGGGSGLRLGWGRWIGLSLVAPNGPQSFRDQEMCQSRRVNLGDEKITQPVLEGGTVVDVLRQTDTDSTRGVMTLLTLLVGPDETGNGT
jgi:hypothetical protein